jgi:hypothetical protein
LVAGSAAPEHRIFSCFLRSSMTGPYLYLWNVMFDVLCHRWLLLFQFLISHVAKLCMILKYQTLAIIRTAYSSKRYVRCFTDFILRDKSYTGWCCHSYPSRWW